MHLADPDRLVSLVEGFLDSIGFAPTAACVELLAELLACYPARLTLQELSLRLDSDEFEGTEIAIACRNLFAVKALRVEGEFVRPGDDLLCFRASFFV
jgi:hypothetical protein